MCAMRTVHISVGLRRRGGNISVDLSLSVSLYNTKIMNKLKFNDLKKTLKNEFIDCTSFFNVQNHPTFHARERLVNLLVERGRECFGGLSVLVDGVLCTLGTLYNVHAVYSTLLHYLIGFS